MNQYLQRRSAHKQSSDGMTWFQEKLLILVSHVMQRWCQRPSDTSKPFLLEPIWTPCLSKTITFSIFFLELLLELIMLDSTVWTNRLFTQATSPVSSNRSSVLTTDRYLLLVNRQLPPMTVEHLQIWPKSISWDFATRFHWTKVSWSFVHPQTQTGSGNTNWSFFASLKPKYILS